MIFSSTTDIESFALDALEQQLEGELAQQPYLSQFSQWGGAAVVTDVIKLQEYQSSKRPFLFLEVASHEISGNVRKRHELEISCEVVTTSACLPAESALKSALLQIIEKSYFALRESGLNAVRIRAGQGKNNVPQRINPHTISCLMLSE